MVVDYTTKEEENTFAEDILLRGKILNGNWRYNPEVIHCPKKGLHSKERD
jgi:hypothetical protein